ncbi:uncharacterized protein LOC131671275 [Phymastichus coffea]|uniref:uncharacterized protein LOC131671275 n=1 Tax=Phymastichus coffea TaxID=108790 RepID=UPI00273A99FB|nr:uncharacterized protein LOC131671275 [Phymastichus coffea]XP_058803553.1 uncharacterized protein LOC131671275 [Phymastichus coffea]
MNYYQDTYAYNDNYDRPMLGPSEDESQDAVSDGPDYDPDYDEEVNRLLDEVEEEILQENSNPPTEEDSKARNAYADPKREQYDDCYDEFPEDMHHVGPVPVWYQKMLENKMKQTRSRLENLSNLVCYACTTAGAHVKRMEQDHSSVFCKMDFPRHPPLNKPWTNFWKFNCMIKCRDIDKPNHAHTADCESIVLEHANTGVSTLTQNISQNDYPKFVMDAVELFQDFAMETTKSVPYLDATQAVDTVYEKPTWTEIKLRSNYKNELMIVVRGKGVTSLLTKLRKFFDSGPGRTSNVISVFCINQKWSQKKTNFPPTYVTGLLKLRDKVGPISINYEPKTNVAFNSIEAIQLGKVIHDYANLTDDTTLLDIGCNFGVLSLMMSHKCDRVIGLNTMHFANSEINQAEELKKYNNIHNVSFMGCDPKDVLTKCSTIIKRCMTVAVLNLASPYGKSIHVMQALRDLPSIWKVIVYGSFTKEYHRNISMLTYKDDLMGEHYLPMQYCILDKSPSIEHAFDIVILFERKSLMNPIIRPLVSHPAMNIKSESKDYGSLDTRQTQPIMKLEKGFGTSDFRPKKYGKPFIKYRGSLSKFGKFDSPMIPLEKEQPEKSKDKSKEGLSLPPVAERKFDCSVLRQKPPPISPTANTKKNRSVYPSVRKELKRIYDSPSLPMLKEEQLPATNEDKSPPTLLKTESFDCSLLRKEKQFDYSVMKNQEFFSQQSRDTTDKQLPLSRPFLSVKKEFQYSCPTLSREKYPSPPSPPPPHLPPLPPTEHSILEELHIKKEEFTNCPLTTVKVETILSESKLYEEKEEGELSSEEDRIPSVPIKSEKLDSSYFVEFSEFSSQSLTVKSEPVDSYEIPFQSVEIKTEPENMQISPCSEDIENMKTPIHNPRALSNTSSPLVVSTNFKTIDGFEFSVRPNQSFLASKTNSNTSLEQKSDIEVKKEVANDSDMDEEIKIIDEKKISVQPKKQLKGLEPRIRVKSLDEIIQENSESNDDLRALIEQRKMLQWKLDRDKEARYYKEHGRSPTPEIPQKNRHQWSHSPSPSFKKNHWSPSSRESKHIRSPSLKKYYRSPSPHKWHRSPSSRKRRSPMRWIARERSSSIERYRRSPSPNGKRRRRSPSPNGRRRRSPSPNRRRRRSPSPNERFKRSYPSPIQYKREYSPLRYKRELVSPVSSRWLEKSRSPSPSLSHKIDHYGRSKSPVRSRRDSRKRRSRSRSPVENKRKRRSLSPIPPSSSPLRKQHINSKDRDPVKKKKKKFKFKSKSKSPSKTSKNKSTTTAVITIKDEPHGDIPVLSTSPSISKSPNEVIHKSNVEATTENVQISQTEPIKQEHASRSRSRTPIPGLDDSIEMDIVV